MANNWYDSVWQTGVDVSKMDLKTGIRGFVTGVLSSVATLQALSPAGHYAFYIKDAGLYFYDSADTTTADNGASCIVSADGGRYKRQTVSLYLPSGGVIDWNSSDVVITHAANVLGFTGGSFGFGTNSPDRLFHAEFTDGATNATANAARFTHLSSGTVTTGFGIGFEWELENAAGTPVVAAAQNAIWTDATAGSEDSKFTWAVLTAGAGADKMLLDGAMLAPTSNDGLALGSSSLMWSDLFLASGSVINWNNGDVTATHAANALTFAGATTYGFTQSGATPLFVLERTDTHGNAANVGNWQVYGRDSAGNAHQYAGILFQAVTATNGAEAGAMYFGVSEGGTFDYKAVMFGSAFYPYVSDGIALGTTAAMWSDLFLGNGAVINFNNGDVTVTHAADALTFAGGKYTFTASGNATAGTSSTYPFRLLDGSSNDLTMGYDGSKLIIQSWNGKELAINPQGNVVTFRGIGTTASAANAYIDNAANNSLLRSTSSRVYKRDIEPLDAAFADSVLKLQPVWYRSKAPADNAKWSWYGLIAEDVAEVDPRLVHWGYHDESFDVVTTPAHVSPDGEEIPETTERVLKPDAKLVPDGVQYERLSVLLLDVVQRLTKRVEELETRLANM